MAVVGGEKLTWPEVAGGVSAKAKMASTSGEEWRVCADTVQYEVSSVGAVRNAQTKNVMKPFITDTGNARVTRRVNDKYKSDDIHRLVAAAFLPNPENKPYVIHVNHVNSDNRVENLRWATRSEAAKHNAEKRKSEPPTPAPAPAHGVAPVPPVVSASAIEWRPCADIPGYDVSNYGAVRNSVTHQAINVHVDRRSICSVHIARSVYMVHRLVAKAFLASYRDDCSVIHIDGDKTNNAATNLVCTTHSGAIKAALDRKKAERAGTSLPAVAPAVVVPRAPIAAAEAPPSEAAGPKLDPAYLSGFIDGDGSICISKCGATGHQMKVEMTQCNVAFLSEINASFGGAGQIYTDTRADKYRNEPASTLRFCGKKAIPLLTIMLERGIVKRQQAAVAMEFLKYINLPGKAAEREACFLRMKELNADKEGAGTGAGGDDAPINDAYIAGLLDANGTIYNGTSKERGIKEKQYVRITQISEPDLLKSIRAHVSAGTIAEKDPDRLRFFGKTDVTALWNRVKTNLKIKKEEYEALLTEM